MKLMNKTLLAIAIASIASPSYALWSTGIATTKTVIQEGVASQKAAVKASTDGVFTLETGESLTANDTITVNLVGGATFSSTPPQLKCSTGDLGGGVNTFTSPLTGGAAGSTSATWRSVDALCVATKLLTLNSNTAAIFDVTNVTDGNNVDILLTLKTSSNVVIGTASHSIQSEKAKYAFTGKKLFTLTETTSSDTAQVAQLYKLFGTTTPTLTTAAKIKHASNSDANSVPTQDVSAKKLLLTLSGDFNGITSIAATGVTGDDGTGAGAGVAGAFTINAAKTKAYAVNTAAITSAGGSLDIADLKLTLDGTTSQPARSFALKAELLADTLFSAHTARPASTFVTITRDGTCFSSNSTGGLNNIKITDMSGILPATGGSITVSAFDQAGNVIAANPPLPATYSVVMNNATTILNGGVLAASFPNAVRYDVIVNSVDANITNVKNTATGLDTAHFRSGATGGGL